VSFKACRRLFLDRRDIDLGKPEAPGTSMAVMTTGESRAHPRAS